MRKKWLLPLLSVLPLTPWPIAYAFDSAGASVDTGNGIQVAAAGAEAAPSWTAYGRAIGGANPGDLFYVNATESPADIAVTLLITNTDELIHHYRYLNLKVGTYRQTADGQWQPATWWDGNPLPDTYLTLRGAAVTFSLPGQASYKVTIDGGAFYCYGTGGEGSAAPTFYLTAE
ncbi:MAG: hypothetical protein V1780_05100 [Chloroflexota bacterium]